MTTPLAAERDLLREALVRRGFSDDGDLLRGGVAWSHPTSGEALAQAEVLIPDAFPFVPPKVRIVDSGTDTPLTFHVELPEEGAAFGWLCLWESSHDVARAPWRDADALIARVGGHLKLTAAGWPDDTACDLERYLPATDGLVLYDQGQVVTLSGRRVRVRRDAATGVVQITGEIRSWEPRSGRRAGRKDYGLAYVDDLGELDTPIRSWSDLRDRLGARADRLSRDIALGLVSWLVLGYARSGQRSVLVLHARGSRGQIDLRAVECADTSDKTRQLRAGPDRELLSGAHVAIVGVGAVGSFCADILFRAGVRHLTLIDYEVLRPGNVVRHLVGDQYVGWLKADAVAAVLGERGATTRNVKPRRSRIQTIELARGVVRSHDLVIDATGDALATSLLAAVATPPPSGGPRVLSACVQRQGQVVRVDALPAFGGEPHLPPLQRHELDQLEREQGCGSPVSLTPPGSVIASAELVSRLAISALTDPGTAVPSSVATVFTGQSEEPYTQTGTITSRSTSVGQPPSELVQQPRVL